MTVHQCPTCGKQLEPSVRFCPDDGTPLTDTAAAGALKTPTGLGVDTQKMQVQLPVVVGNRYKLTEVRGGGGMAKVYKATDLTLDRTVAVKLINPELRNDPEFDARFQREAKIASQLSDPHIVVVHDFGLDPTQGPYLVMEFLQGMSLRERLAAEGPMPLKAGMQLCGQVFLALIHAHGKGIVHRDIKPDNLFLLNQSGVRLHMRVLDFGIARIFRRDDPSHAQTITHAGAVLGTPRYMSPEQLAGQPVDARSDIYSAALVLYEAMTGQLPYVSSRKLSDLCPDAPPALQSLLESCLKPNPDERPANAIEVYLRLQELGKASGILMLPPGAIDKLLANRPPSSESTTETFVPPGAKPPPSARRRLLIAAAVALLLMLIAAATYFLWHRDTIPSSGAESLLGIKIGDSESTALGESPTLKQLPPAKEVNGNPWTGEYSAFLEHVLQRKDLEAAGVPLDEITLLAWPDQKVFLLCHQNKVQAVVTRQSHAASGRGVHVGDNFTKIVESAYKDENGQSSRFPPEGRTQLDKMRLPPWLFTSGAPDSGSTRRSGVIYRYLEIGINFEVVKDHVTAIALYPPRSLEDPSREP
jgi:serine/threonine-protein kinase